MAATPNATESAEEVDAWTARFARAPVGQVPIDLICLSDRQDPGIADMSSAADTLRRKGRLGKVIQVCPEPESPCWGDALTRGLALVSAPVVVISDAGAEWNRDILERLIKSIDMCDLALGARPCTSMATRIGRTLASMGRGLFWGAGVLDPLSPYKLARTETLRGFPFQSSSRFVDVEMIAKANFLDALIHEEVMPVAEPWTTPRFGAGARADRRNLFRAPAFRHIEKAAADEDPETCANQPASDVKPADSGSPEPCEDVRTPGSDGSTDV